MFNGLYTGQIECALSVFLNQAIGCVKSPSWYMSFHVDEFKHEDKYVGVYHPMPLEVSLCSIGLVQGNVLGNTDLNMQLFPHVLDFLTLMMYDFICRHFSQSQNRCKGRADDVRRRQRLLITGKRLLTLE